MSLGDLLFSVIVPTRGEPAKLLPLLGALERQTLERNRFEVILSFDGIAPDPEIARRLAETGVASVASPERRGPGAARNLAARLARGAYLAMTEDDCVPADDWLERAAERLDPATDVLVGETIRPDGRPSRRPTDHPHYLPTNLIVRRSLFDRLGGYAEDYFDPRAAVYFREDSDLGFRLEAVGARIAGAPGARVVHPVEHPRYLDPLRWARRYRMDGLLQARHPRLFRERIEVQRVGPFTVRRLFVRACYAFVFAMAASGLAALLGQRPVALLFLCVAILALVPVWMKWGWNPARLPVLGLVPFVLVANHLNGLVRSRPAPGKLPL